MNVYEQLCSYDPRNPDNIRDLYDDCPEPRQNCACDNCWTGRDRLAAALIEADLALRVLRPREDVVQALRDLVEQVSARKLDVKKDFSLMVAQANATKLLHELAQAVAKEEGGL
jgi:predicted DsbA family dithiol-disulfide isomerase